MKLVLRRAVVIDSRDVTEGAEQNLVVEVEGAGEREAVCDTGLLGICQVGDEVIVNTQASDLRLGSGGFDIVHVNLTRGLDGEGLPGAHVMKLNYTSLQHAVEPVEGDQRGELGGRPVAACLLHGQLAPLAWAFARAAPGARLGLVQGGGGALPGNHSRTVARLREEGLVAGFITASPSYGGEMEAMSVAGALAFGIEAQGWDAAVCAPGPGIIGSGSRFGNGALAAADALCTAVALGGRGLLVPRLSDSDPRERHRGTSHHTLTVAALVPPTVVVPWPEGRADEDVGGLELRGGAFDIDGYTASGLPQSTMGRAIAEDQAFFSGPLAAGSVLGALARG